MTQQAKPTVSATSSGFPRALLVGAAALLTFALVATAAGRVSRIGLVQLPKAEEVRSLPLHIVDQDDGSAVILHAYDRRILHIVEPGKDGFIRATLRGFVRERKLSNIGDATPFTLTHWSNGTLSLSDSTTGRRVSLEAFGPTNAQAFAQLFSEGAKK